MRYSWPKQGALTPGGGGGGGGGPVTIADGANVTVGTIADAAVIGDVAGTQQAKLRGIGAILANVWNSASGKLKVEEVLPVGAATSALQTSGNTTLTTITGQLAAPLPAPTGVALDGTDGIGAPIIPGTGIRGWLRSIYDRLVAGVAVTGTFWQATQPVSIAAPVAVTGTFFQATQPISGTVALGAGAATIGSVAQGAAGAAPWPVNDWGLAASLNAVGTAAAPLLGGVVATLAAPPAGTYRIDFTCGFSGATAEAIPNNMALQVGGVVTNTPVLTGAAGSQVSTSNVVAVLNGAQALTVNAIAAATALTVYNASITATRIA